MQLKPVRNFLVLILALLCLGLASYPVSLSPIVAPGTASLAKEAPETKLALPSHRNGVQAVVSARDPVAPSAGGSIVAVLPILTRFALRKRGSLSASAVSATVPSL